MRVSPDSHFFSPNAATLEFWRFGPCSGFLPTSSVPRRRIPVKR